MDAKKQQSKNAEKQKKFTSPQIGFLSIVLDRLDKHRASKQEGYVSEGEKKGSSS